MSGLSIIYAVADLFREKPFGESVVLKKLDGSAPKSIKLLFEATRSLVYAGKLEKASEQFNESLALHATTIQLVSHKERLSPVELVALHHSIVWNAALLKGFQLASPSKELLPFLVTKKWLGL